jgi:hypothetical protein
VWWKGWKYAAYIWMKTVKWDPSNTDWKGGKEGGSALILSTLYECMELSQWNPL